MRDIIFDTNKGFILSETLTIAGLIPGDSSDYIKSVSRFDAYFTLFDLPVSESFSFKSVLKFHTALSYLAPKGGIPINVQNDGFSFSGMFMARGWNPVSGGQTLWDNTIELRFPIVMNILSFDLFADMVGLWGSKDDFTTMKIQDFKFSVGLGLRLANPSFPFSLYLVKKFNVNEDNTINWNPEPSSNVLGEFDLVISFGIDIYQ